MNYIKLKLRLPALVRLVFQLNFTCSFCQNLSKLFLKLLILLLSTTESGRLFRVMNVSWNMSWTLQCHIVSSSLHATAAPDHAKNDNGDNFWQNLCVITALGLWLSSNVLLQQYEMSVLGRPFGDLTLFALKWDSCLLSWQTSSSSTGSRRPLTWADATAEHYQALCCLWTNWHLYP